MSSCSSTIFWKDCLFFHWIAFASLSTGHICMSLFLGSLFHWSMCLSLLILQRTGFWDRMPNATCWLSWSWASCPSMASHLIQYIKRAFGVLPDLIPASLSELITHYSSPYPFCSSLTGLLTAPQSYQTCFYLRVFLGLFPYPRTFFAQISPLLPL